MSASMQCRNLFEGQEVTIAYNNLEPFFYAAEINYGMDYEMILFLAQAIGFKPKYYYAGT